MRESSRAGRKVVAVVVVVVAVVIILIEVVGRGIAAAEGIVSGIKDNLKWKSGWSNQCELFNKVQMYN